MMIGKTIQIIDSHTAGEPTRIITGGVPELPGDTILEKRAYFEENFDYIRRSLFQEPRGLLRGEGALIIPAVSKDADLGVIFMNSNTAQVNMCGHGSMGVITAAIEFGMVEAVEPVTEVVLEVPAGLIRGRALVQNGTVESVAIQTVPSFLFQSARLDIPDYGRIPADIAYGGGFMVLVAVEDLGMTVDVKSVSQLTEVANSIRQAANDQVKVEHPHSPLKVINGIRFYEKPSDGGTHIKSVTVLGAGVDRSPCGAGCSAHQAAMYAKGQIGLDQECIHESAAGTMFTCKLISTSKVGSYDAVLPEIAGSAYTMGMTTAVLSPNDPLKNGFLFG
jgi:proline racemase